MSAPEPSLTPPLGPSLTFGGYAGEPGELQGVGFWPRVGARVIDWIVHTIAIYAAGLFLGAVIAIAAMLVHGINNANPAVQEALAKIQGATFLPMLAGLVGATLYEIVLEAGHGSTLGKLALGMTVVQEDGGLCRFRSAVVRSLAYYIDGLFFGLIGYMEMKGSVKEQRHGDNWAHTVVCKRSDLKPEQLRSGGRFAVFFLLALVLDAAAFLTAMTAVLML